MEKGHKTHTNANESTKAYAFKWLSPFQGPENLLEGDPSPDSQRPVQIGAPPVCGTHMRQHSSHESEEEIRSMDAGKHAPIEFNLLQLEHTALETSQIPREALKCTRTITPTKGGLLEFIPGKAERQYEPELLEGYNIDPWVTTKVTRRDLGRAKVKIRKATKWKKGTRKKHNQDQITLTCTCQHIQINSNQIEIMVQDCATHSLESTILVMRTELDDDGIEAGRQMIQEIPGDLLCSKQAP
jgi:hypothetical protein